jgi:hypothetical protein
MRAILLGITLLLLTTPFAIGAEPLVEQYLHSGRLARGEQAMEAALAADPVDDQLRFGRAVLQLVKGVERLGQGLYQYGCVAGANDIFLRIPIPTNPDPSTITYADLRRMLDAFRSNLATVESTLSVIKSKDVKLPLRLANIRLNMTGKPDANEKFIDILKKLMGPNFRLPADNPDFLVCFDRGDVAWLRAYCHLLMGMIDLTLAVDLEESFNLTAEHQFAKPKHVFRGDPQERSTKQNEIWLKVQISEPARWGHFRRHMLKVCELNRETWSFIRSETDNDHEWLPNPKQTGVLRMPVTDEMIDGWLEMMAEFESLYDGKKAFPKEIIQFISPPTKRGLNFKAFLDNPPDEIDVIRVRDEGIREQYLDESLPPVDIMKIVRVFSIFQNTLAVGYAAWFN